MSFGKNRLADNKIKYQMTNERFGEKFIWFEDPDGLQINLIIPNEPDNRKSWTTEEVNENVATKGFHSITLTLQNIKGTADVLTEIFGYKFLKQENDRFRFITDAIEGANIVDLVEAPNVQRGFVAGGTNHHVAFRVQDDDILMTF